MKLIRSSGKMRDNPSEENAVTQILKNKLRLSKLNTFIPLKAKEAQRVEIECCEASKKVVAVLHDHDLILKRKTNEALN